MYEGGGCKLGFGERIQSKIRHGQELGYTQLLRGRRERGAKKGNVTGNRRDNTNDKMTVTTCSQSVVLRPSVTPLVVLQTILGVLKTSQNLVLKEMTSND